MKHFLIIVLIFLVGCTPSVTSIDNSPQEALYYGGGDGTSFDEAVTFPGAKSSAEGVPLERKWLTERFPGYRKGLQRSMTRDGRRYDVQTIMTSTGEERTFYFDMTSWFGFRH